MVESRIAKLGGAGVSDGRGCRGRRRRSGDSFRPSLQPTLKEWMREQIDGAEWTPRMRCRLRMQPPSVHVDERRPLLVSPEQQSNIRALCRVCARLIRLVGSLRFRRYSLLDVPASVLIQARAVDAILEHIEEPAHYGSCEG